MYTLYVTQKKNIPQQRPFFYIIILFLLFIGNLSKGYSQEPVTTVMEQHLETMAENNPDNEVDDDGWLADMQHFIRHPLDINRAGEEDWQQLRILSPLQIQRILDYHSLLGDFINVYELQAVPLLDPQLLEKIKPYLLVSPIAAGKEMGNRLKDGDQSLLIRVSQTMERSIGYNPDSGAVNYYPGSPQKLLIRYKYAYKNLLQFGLLAEKDAGEQFFKGGQKKGFDFYSVHFFTRRIGMIKALALGDFTVNMGQGLLQWQSLSFKKGADVTNIKHQSPLLRPYQSAGEIIFLRGAGITLDIKKWQVSLFGSNKRIDGHIIKDSGDRPQYISSFQTSGYHRTSSELAERGTEKQWVWGAALSHAIRGIHLGVNMVHYHFGLPLQKGGAPYQKFVFSGTQLANYSVEYAFSIKNMHLFGEAALDGKGNKAIVNGLMISVSSRADLAFLYRNISKEYQSMYNSAFTENTSPVNETGFYSGISIRPSPKLVLNAYADFFSFPWLRYRVDAPSTGSEFLVWLDYQPLKTVEIYSRFRRQDKSMNFTNANPVLNPVIPKIQQNWRTQFSYKLNPAYTVRGRVELLWLNKRGELPETGFLFSTDILFHPPLKPFRAGARLVYFETDSYDSRVYSYENDVSYSFSIPPVYGKGIRYYVNAGYNWRKIGSIGVRLARSIYSDKSFIGSGLDKINGNHKTEINVQVMVDF